MKVSLALVLLPLLTIIGCAKSNIYQHDFRQMPPAEAIEACEGKQAGKIVEFTDR